MVGSSSKDDSIINTTNRTSSAVLILAAMCFVVRVMIDLEYAIFEIAAF